MSSSRPTMLRAFNREPLSLSMLELRRVALKSVGLEEKEDGLEGVIGRWDGI